MYRLAGNFASSYFFQIFNVALRCRKAFACGRVHCKGDGIISTVKNAVARFEWFKFPLNSQSDGRRIMLQNRHSDVSTAKHALLKASYG